MRVNALIVASNAAQLGVLKQQLSAWGMVVDTAQTGAQTLEKLQLAFASTPYRLALLDLRLADSDTLNLVQRIQEDPCLATVNLVVLMPAAAHEQVDPAASAGIAAILSKPIRQSQLLTCLVQVLHRGQQVPTEEIQSPVEIEGIQGDFHASVLLAEDNPVNQLVAEEMLEILGCRVTVAENGERALEALVKANFDIVLMDCQMPGMDGYAATAAIRAEQAGSPHESHFPIVALTANALQGDRERCLAAGMDDYLSKPFTHTELKVVLERWLKRSAASDEKRERDIETKTAEQEISLLDEAALNNIRALQPPGKPNILNKVIDQYIESVPLLVQRLRDAIERQDAAAIRLAAHSLKSSSANLGAQDLADLAKKLEAMGHKNLTAGAEALLQEIEVSYDPVAAELRRMVV